MYKLPGRCTFGVSLTLKIVYMTKVAKIPTPRFNLKVQGPQGGKDIPTLVLLVIRYNGQKLVWSTQQFVKPRFWDKKTCRAKITIANSEDAKLNQALNEIQNTALTIFDKLGLLPVADLKKELDYIFGRKEREADAGHLELLPFLDWYLNMRKMDVKHKRGTWKMLQTASNLLKQYAEEKHGGQLKYEDATWDFHHNFKQWLFAPPREHSTNYAAKVIDLTGQFMREARKRGHHDNDRPEQSGWPIKKVRIPQQVLSFEELDTLAALDLAGNQRLEQVRDAFLIGAYTGLRFSDFTRISKENVIDEAGTKILAVKTQKTGAEVEIPFLSTLEAILEKYDWQSPPPISNQKFNAYIKEVCELAGFTEVVIKYSNKAGRDVEERRPKCELIKSHTARRSFATNFFQLGLPAAMLMQVTGHSTEKQFMAYINISKRDNARKMAVAVARLMGERYLRKVN